MRAIFWQFAPVGMLLTVALLAFTCLFTTLAPYDDEGYVMMTLRTFGQGHSLYAQTHTQYGPAFYWLTEPIHSVMGLPLTQDGVRLKSLLYWCGIACLAAWMVHRLCGNRSASILTGLWSGLHLEKLSLEPGHPQELALLLSLLAMAALARSLGWGWLLAGILAGCVTMIKVNCGLTLFLGLALTAAYPWTQHPKWGSAFRGLLIAIGVLFPGMVFWGSIQHPNGWWMPFMSMAALVVLVLEGNGPSRNGTELRNNGQLWAGCAIAVAAVLGLTWWDGTRLPQLVWGILGQHRQFTSTFFHPVVPSLLAIVTSLGLATILVVRQRRYRMPWFNRTVAIGLPIGMGLLLLGTAIDAARPLVHGLEPRGLAPTLAVLGPWLGVGMALTPMALRDDRNWAMRRALALATCLAPLIAFPTPGTQLSLGTLPGLMAGCVWLGDLWRKAWLTHQVGVVLKPSPSPLLVAAIVLVMAVSLSHGYRWKVGQGLDVAGSRLLRLEKSVAHPLTPANPTFWPRMLTSAEQQGWLDSIDRTSRLCVVIPPESDRLAGDHARPVRRALYSHWIDTMQVDTWQVATRQVGVHD
jgi:hypothetical protein